MKAIVSAAAIIFIVCLLTNCNKSNDPQLQPHINCDGLVTDTLGTNDSGRIYMPNAFTPDNNDGLNDYLAPFVKGIRSIEFTVFDENNKIVFNTSELKQGWHPSGGSVAKVTYYYKIQAVTTANRKIGLCGEAYRLTCFPKNIPQSSLHFPSQFTGNGFDQVPSGEVMGACPN